MTSVNPGPTKGFQVQLRTLFFTIGMFLSGAILPVTQAYADDAAKMGEKLRLEEELKKLAQRNAWAGVERKYLELLRLKIDLPFEDHEMGAQSAGSLGKTYAVYERLLRAQELEDRVDINNSIAHIDANFGRIDIQGHEKRRPDLNPDIMPFAPDQRKSIEWARQVIKNTGSFNGMLPAGSYSVCSQEFTVAPGAEFLVVKLKKFTAKELKACGSGEDVVVSTIEYSGPIAHLGFNFMSTPQPFQSADEFAQSDVCGGEKCNGSELDGYGAQPQSFSGGGMTVGGGYEVGFNQIFGAAVEVGYSNMLDGKSTSSGNAGSFHAFHGSLGAVVRPGDFRLGIGPVFSVYRGSGKGVAPWFDIDQDHERYPTLGQSWKGVSGAAGAQLTLGYGLTDFGKLQGVVELGANWSTDGTRHFINTGLRVGIVPLIERFSQ
jgi:hypothetical protein